MYGLELGDKKPQKFYCCLCTEKLDKVEVEYQCPLCLRFICKKCFDDLKSVNVHKCPYCTTLIEEVEQGKENQKSCSSLRSLVFFYYERKNWEATCFFSLKVLKINPEDSEVKNIYIEADYMMRSYY